MIYKVWAVSSKRYVFGDFSLTSNFVWNCFVCLFSKHVQELSLMVNPFWLEHLNIFNIPGTPPHTPPFPISGKVWLPTHLVRGWEFKTIFDIASCQIMTTWRMSPRYPSFMQVREWVTNALIMCSDGSCANKRNHKRGQCPRSSRSGRFKCTHFYP